MSVLDYFGEVRPWHPVLCQRTGLQAPSFVVVVVAAAAAVAVVVGIVVVLLVCVVIANMYQAEASKVVHLESCRIKPRRWQRWLGNLPRQHGDYYAVL